MGYEVYSRAMGNHVQRLNQEEDDMVIKAKMFNEYSKPEHYEQLKDNPNVLAAWGENIYILPDVLVLDGIKYNSLPDAIIGNYFVEFKNTETFNVNTISGRIKNGIKKSDIILFYVENNEKKKFKEVLSIYLGTIKNKINKINDVDYEGKIVIIFDGNSKEKRLLK